MKKFFKSRALSASPLIHLIAIAKSFWAITSWTSVIAPFFNVFIFTKKFTGFARCVWFPIGITGAIMFIIFTIIITTIPLTPFVD